MHPAWTIGKRLAVAFGVVALLLATASVMGLVNTVRSRSSQDRTTSIAAATRAAAEVEALIQSLDANQKLIIVAGLTGVVERSAAGHAGVTTATAHLAERLATLRSLANDARSRAIVDRLASEVDAWKDHHAEILALIEKQEFDHALTIDLGASYTTQQGVLKQAEDLQRVLSGEAEATRASAQRTFAVSMTVAVVVVVAAFLVGAVVTMVIRRITSSLAAAASELRSSSQHVAAASGQVSASAQALSQGATEQAASLEETSASMEEMASMTRKNAENSQEAAGQVAETQQLVEGANVALSDLVASMATIRESSTKVTKIIKTIDEIAFQTNILALNAAVEAARAGEAGMGFAVVADEVRNLAQRSAQAAKDTAVLIEASAGNAASGGAKVDAVVTAMSAITASSTRVRSLIEEVSTASRQQAQGIDQVTQAVAQMEKVTQTTAATAEESAAASQELTSQAGQSMAVVQRLEAMVRGGHGGPGSVTPAAAGGAATRTATKGPRLVTRGAQTPRPAEQPHPLDDTGTFGRF
ncbi:MAG: methyl-accepting chemotaxis protein [Vicinamibacterales bacterium]|nr:methyl-accepting chemotaxis protein [Vicinamibacterales bacterium]